MPTNKNEKWLGLITTGFAYFNQYSLWRNENKKAYSCLVNLSIGLGVLIGIYLSILFLII